MAPSIEAYNNRIDAGWENLEKEPIYSSLTADLDHYQRLTSFIFTLVNQMDAKKIHFIDTHESIIKFLNKDETYYVTNIDHHHDVGYIMPPKPDEPLNCGNWVKFVPNLISYTWINNDNSHAPEEPYEDKKYNIKPFRDLDLSTLAVPDELFICLSTPWVPKTFRPLFFTWMDLCNGIKGTHFDFED
jgi:hypothetical protein